MNGYFEPNRLGPVPASSASYSYSQAQPNSVLFPVNASFLSAMPPSQTNPLGNGLTIQPDMLNSSFGEKNWLTATLNESQNGLTSSGSSGNSKNNGASTSSFLNNSFNLNNSMNLPPELRYKALSDMVGKITDEEFLAASASGNASTLNFNNYKTMYQQPSVQATQPIHYFRQDSNPNINSSYEPIYTQLFRESETEKQSPVKASYTGAQSQLPQIKEDQLVASIPAMGLTSEASKTNTGMSDGKIPLAFPATYSHHLAKLNAEQQAYMMTQQQALVATMEQMTMQQIKTYNPNETVKPTPPNSQQHPPHLQHMISSSSSSSQSSTTSPLNIFARLHSQQSASSPTAPYGPTSELRQVNERRSVELNNNQSIKPKAAPVQPPPPLPQSSTFPQVMVHPNQQHLFQPMMNLYMHPNFHPSGFQGENLIHATPNLIAYPNGFFLPNGIIDPASFMLNMANNDKFKFMMKSDQNTGIGSPQLHHQQQQQPSQAYRQHRRTGPANELHIRLEECMNQFKCIENERKKFEADLSHISLSRKAISANQASSQSSIGKIILTIPSTSSVRLPPNPSRVDRLIYDCMREYARLVTLVLKIDNLRSTIFFESIQQTFKKWLEAINNVQQKRKDELMNNANKQRLQPNSGINSGRQSDEKDVIILASSIHELSSWTKRARTSLWCAIQISNVNYKQDEIGSSGQAGVTSESLFDSLEKTHQFINKTFDIKTDLIKQ